MGMDLTPPERFEPAYTPVLSHAYDPEQSAAMKMEFHTAAEIAKKLEKNPIMIFTNRNAYNTYNAALKKLPTIGLIQ